MKPYDTELSKKEEVRAMFDNIAPAYDRLNHTLSLSVDRIWRRRVVRIDPLTFERTEDFGQIRLPI